MAALYKKTVLTSKRSLGPSLIQESYGLERNKGTSLSISYAFFSISASHPPLMVMGHSCWLLPSLSLQLKQAIAAFLIH